MKYILKLIAAILIFSSNLNGQVFEPQIIADNIQGSNGIVFHDFNDDGIKEYVITRFSQDVVTMLYWDGADYIEKELISIDEPSGMTLGDFNDDGRIDIALCAANISGIRILRNQGDLEFSVQTINSFDYDDAGSIEAADIDLDGDLDLILSSYKRDDVAIFEMTNPDFFSFDVSIIDSNVDSRDIQVEDLDNDGFPDIVSTNRFGNELNLYFNAGNNSFQKVTYPLSGATKASLADFNNDSYLDIGVTSFSDDALSVFLNNTDATFQEILVDGSVQSPSSISSFDINNDNTFDIVVGSNEGIKVFLIEDITNNVHMREDYPFDGWVGPFDVVDIDGDDDLDLVASSTGLPGIIHYLNTTIISSIDKIEEISTNIYPNPTQDIINIEIAENTEFEVRIYNLQGEFIKSHLNLKQIDFSSLPKGQYILEIEDIEKNIKAIKKIIVEK